MDNNYLELINNFYKFIYKSDLLIIQQLINIKVNFKISKN